MRAIFIPSILNITDNDYRSNSMADEIRTAATAVILRDSGDGVEVLLLRRHPQLKVGGGHWVFPGGTVDPGDAVSADTEQQAARRAAVRETAEEASLKLDESSLKPISHWTTPAKMGRRFATWFFLTRAGGERVVVDGQEMDDYQWQLPRAFIQQHRGGELPIMPPTLVTLNELARCGSVAEAEHFYRRRSMPFYQPQINQHLDSLCMLYQGDAGYLSADPSVPGARNRCYLEDGIWRYEWCEN